MIWFIIVVIFILYKWSPKSVIIPYSQITWNELYFNIIPQFFLLVVRMHKVLNANHVFYTHAYTLHSYIIIFNFIHTTLIIILIKSYNHHLKLTATYEQRLLYLFIDHFRHHHHHTYYHHTFYILTFFFLSLPSFTTTNWKICVSSSVIATSHVIPLVFLLSYSYHRHRQHLHSLWKNKL